MSKPKRCISRMADSASSCRSKTATQLPSSFAVFIRKLRAVERADCGTCRIPPARFVRNGAQADRRQPSTKPHSVFATPRHYSESHLQSSPRDPTRSWVASMVHAAQSGRRAGRSDRSGRPRVNDPPSCGLNEGGSSESRNDRAGTDGVEHGSSAPGGRS